MSRIFEIHCDVMPDRMACVDRGAPPVDDFGFRRPEIPCSLNLIPRNTEIVPCYFS